MQNCKVCDSKISEEDSTMGFGNSEIVFSLATICPKCGAEDRVMINMSDYITTMTTLKFITSKCVTQ